MLKEVVVSQCSVVCVYVCVCVCGRKKEDEARRRKKKRKRKTPGSDGGIQALLKRRADGLSSQSEAALPPPAGLAGSGQGCDSHPGATVIGRRQPHLPRRTQKNIVNTRESIQKCMQNEVSSMCDQKCGNDKITHWPIMIQPGPGSTAEPPVQPGDPFLIRTPRRRNP